MWDEKEFFEDFAKKNDTVKPTDAFVSKMKNLENNKPKSIHIYYKPLLVAASILLMLACGFGVYMHIRPDRKPINTIEPSLPGIHLGYDETTPPEDTTFDIASVIGYIENEDIAITGTDGTKLLPYERNNLKALLEKAEKTSSVSGILGENMYYTIHTPTEITIKVYFNKYIIINGQDMYCIE